MGQVNSFIHLFRDGHCLVVMTERAPGVAVALVDLREDNQRDRQVVELAQPAVEVDGGLRGAQPITQQPLSLTTAGMVPPCGGARRGSPVPISPRHVFETIDTASE